MAVGGAASLLINHYTHTITQEMHSGELAISHYPFLLFLTMVLLVLVVQPAFRRIGLRQPLNRSDLIVASGESVDKQLRLWDQQRVISLRGGEITLRRRDMLDNLAELTAL